MDIALGQPAPDDVIDNLGHKKLRVPFRIIASPSMGMSQVPASTRFASTSLNK